MNVHDSLLKVESRQRTMPHLRRLGQFFSTTVLFQAGEERYYLGFERGVLTSILLGSDTKIPWSFCIKTDHKALEEFWQLYPKPGFHDIFGLAKLGRAEIEGDIILLLKNLRFFKEMLALARPRLDA